MQPTLKTVSGFLRYKNQRVVKRYMREYEVTQRVAERVFTEMLKFLYLCMAISTPCSPPSREVDDMWHCFVLHTPDYFKFCGEYAGRFLHHDPTEMPFIGNRSEMLAVATNTFGRLDPILWKHLLTSDTQACNSNCSGDNYCSENCNGGGCQNKRLPDGFFQAEYQRLTAVP